MSKMVLPGICCGIALNKSLLKDGQAVAHGDATVRELETRLGLFVEKTLPMIRRLGGVV